MPRFAGGVGQLSLDAYYTARIMRVMSDDFTLPATEANARLVAGFAGADVRTARRYLNGEPVKGEALKERLAEAVKRAKREQGGGPPFTLSHAVVGDEEKAKP